MENSHNTLFISTLPFSATSADLETFCSEVGPLRSCFVINDKADASKNAGCGFVTFVLADDAAKAISQLKKKKFMDLRFLKIQFARKQADRLQRDVAENQTLTAELPLTVKVDKSALTVKVDKSDKSDELPLTVKVDKSALTVKVDKSDECLPSSHRSLLISDLPGGITKKQLYKKVKKYGTVSSIQFSVGDFKAIIDYNSHEDASNAFKHLNDHVFKGAKIKAEMTRKERYRLFLKNLHFQCTEGDIRKVAQEFGSVKDISVPSKNENRGKGFAFLEYNTKDECEKAILGLRGKKIRGREISLDWAVSKKDFLIKGICAESTKNEAEIQNPSENLDISTSDVGSKSNQDELDYENSDSESENQDFEQRMEQDINVTEELANSDYQGESKDAKKKANKFMEDTTIFIRNLSFDVAQEDLEKCFGVFGKLRYARITMDSETGHSRGSGFVCYLKDEDAKACFNSYQEFINTSVVDEWKENQFSKKGGKEIVSSLTPEPAKALVNSPFFLNGRLLNVTWALSRSDATQAAKDGKARRRAEDKRNMYLITEGVIFPDLDAAKGMSPSELSRRQKSYSERKRLLALNPNLFMSKTRLSIRNLNLQVDDKLLQSAAQNAVSSFWQEVSEGNRESLESDVMEEATRVKYSPIGKKKVWVKQAKILRSKDRIDPVSKLGRSKGYGFVEFLHHCDSLACLRWMNNNPNAFILPDISNDKKEKGNRQRPIVEFAVENKLVLKRRSERNCPKTKEEDKKRKMVDENDKDQKNKKKAKMNSKMNSDKGKSAKSPKVGNATKNKMKNDGPKTDHKISKKPQNKKSLQAKKAGAKIEKVKKSTKKLVNTNISLEDIKKWNV